MFYEILKENIDVFCTHVCRCDEGELWPSSPRRRLPFVETATQGIAPALGIPRPEGGPSAELSDWRKEMRREKLQAILDELDQHPHPTPHCKRA